MEHDIVLHEHSAELNRGAVPRAVLNSATLKNETSNSET